MSIDGIWTGEIYGPFGWDSRGVFVLERGRIIGGDHRQYSTGNYTTSGDAVKANLTTHYYGPPRTVFGEATEQFNVEVEGELANGVITGVMRRPDKLQFELQCRFTKRLELPDA